MIELIIYGFYFIGKIEKINRKQSYNIHNHRLITKTNLFECTLNEFDNFYGHSENHLF